MAYRKDKDLVFLSEMKSEDLDGLVYCLTKDTDGETRWTEELTSSENYKINYPDHQKYWQEIAAEIQCFGANTIATLFRGGEGVLYEEVLRDVADGLKVPYHKLDSVEVIEEKLLMQLIRGTLEKMTPDQLSELGREFFLGDLVSYSPEVMLGAFQAIFKAGGFKSYQLTLMVVNSVMRAIFGKGLTLAGNATLMRAASVFTGPVGWLLTGLWTAWDVAGPATRVTIPAVLQVAFLRKKYEMEKQNLINKIWKEMKGGDDDFVFG
ncbi:DUF3944 domain-containing protein [Allofranklinella schreckenbergeri]|uniref:DUF3944 domain-containing protein n=1 Tax=Allofranklinella schreckenbergeri TaxID=1076744 RepID=A0A3M6Q8L4_9BURK|nr:DUF3944 domain-containing protein [Allofranklinella schreckenbergeri]RMW99266.1 DUF3944 domain-containing protein [Allofranklinella schreckenbergeri]